MTALEAAKGVVFRAGVGCPCGHCQIHVTIAEALIRREEGVEPRMEYPIGYCVCEKGVQVDDSYCSACGTRLKWRR